MRDRGLTQAIEAAGGVQALADKLNCTKQNVSQWKRIPPDRVREVSRVTKVPLYVLAPKLYPKPNRGS